MTCPLEHSSYVCGIFYNKQLSDLKGILNIKLLYFSFVSDGNLKIKSPDLILELT